MKSWSKWISLLLVFVMLLGTLAGCVPENDNPTGGNEDPTESTGSNVEYEPQRPADPGVIPPLDDSTDAPENGVVWDMENLPDDLQGAGWVSAKYGDHADYKAGRTTFTGAAGKGYQGSRAFAVHQNGDYNWSDVFSVGMVNDDTAVRKWAWGSIFWFWYDSTESPGSMMVEFEVNDAHMTIGSNYYVMEDGATTAELAGTLPEGYTGAGYARIPLQGGFKGWVGVDVVAFNTSLKKVNSFTLHFSNIAIGSTIYLDQFCMSNEGPMGASLSMVNKNVATSDKPAWDMENLPADLMASYWAYNEYASSAIAGNFKALSAAGKGVGGSKALRLFQVGDSNWADGITINIKNDSKALNGWENGEVLWFYVDTTEMRNNVSFDLWFDNVKPDVDTPVYGINEQGKIVEAYKMAPAWTDQTFGRILVGAGYKGWVGVPLSAWEGNQANVMNIYIYMAYSSADGNANRSMYMDEFWVLKEGEKPKTATGANIDVLAGKVPAAGSDFTVPGEAWSLESVPSDPLAEGWAEEIYKDHENYEAGHTAVSMAAGKGYKGSAALQIQQTGIYHWSSVYEFNLTKDSTAYTDWLSNNNVLWFWVDASEHTASVGIDLTIDGKQLKHGGEYYIVPDGAASGTIETIPVAYNGASNGRLILPAGFTGWVGAKLSEWGDDVFGGSKLRFHLGYSGSDDVSGKSTYIDSFWVTKTTSAPNGVPAIKPVEGTWDKGGKLWWKPETLPATLYTGENPPLILGGGTPSAHDSYKDYIMGSVANKGIGGTAALQYQYLKDDSSKNWDFDLAIHWQNSSFNHDVSGYEMIWYWVDTTEFANGVDLALELHFAKVKNAVFFTWDGKNDPVPDTTNEWGKVSLPAGFKGYVGLYLADYVAQGFKMGELWHIGFHFQPKSTDTMPASVYIDEIWLTKEGQVPDVPLTDSDVANVPTAAPGGAGTQLWDPETLPDDPYAGSQPALILGQYHSSTGIDDYTPYINAFEAANKGLNGSAALGYTFTSGLSGKDWDFSVGVHWEHSSFPYNWKDIDGDTLWFWVDTTEFAKPVNFEIKIGGSGPDLGAIYYTWDGTSAPVLNTMTAAYDGASHSRIPLLQGYKGYIGIPLSAFSSTDFGAVWNMYFYFDGAAQTNLPGTLYLDEFWLVPAGKVPAVTLGENDYYAGNTETPDPTPDPDPEPDPEPVVGVDKLWDPHSLPEDPYSGSEPALRLGQYHSSTGINDYTPYINAYKAANKGVGGTSALAYEFKSKLDGADWDFTVVAHWQNSSFQYDWATNYSNAELLWFWIDTTGAADAVVFDLQISDKNLKKDAVYYTWDGTNAPVEQAATEAYDGAGFSRIPLAKGYKGFVGVKLADFTGLDLSAVWNFRFYFNGPSQSTLPATLYLDEFWLTAADKLPDVTLGENDYAAGGDPVVPDEPEEEGYVKGGSLLWDPTKLPNDPYTLPSDAGNGDLPALNLGEYNDVSQYIFAAPAVGKGYNMGTGLGFQYNAVNNDLKWDFSLRLHWKYSSYSYDWSNGEVFWFWVDASEFETAINLELQLDGKRLKTDGIFYTWNGVDDPVENALTEAYNGAGYARIPMEKGYAGFIGLKLSDFDGLNAGGIWTIKFYYECADDLDNLPKTLYLDEFWLAKANELPNVAEPITRGGELVWDAENLPEDPTIANQENSQPAFQYGFSWKQDITYTDYIQNLVAADRGFNGGKAWAYQWKQKGPDNWVYYAALHWQESSFQWNWTEKYPNAEMIWFYVDISDYSAGMALEFRIDEVNAANGEYYTWDGVHAPVKAGTVNEYGKVWLNQGYKGFVGIPVEDFVNAPLGAVWCLRFHYEPSDSETLPKAIYIDEIWLTKKNEVPNVTLQLNKGGNKLWGAENLPEDPTAGGQPAFQYGMDWGNPPVFTDYIQSTIAAGRGYNYGKAWAYQWKQKDGNSWICYGTIHHEQSSFKYDWATNYADAEMIWYYVDTSDYSKAIGLEIRIDQVNAPNSEYYTWDGVTAPKKAGTANEYGKVWLSQGYKGYVGIPLAGFAGANLAQVWEIRFHYEPDAAETLPKAIYIDEIWLTKLDQVPNV